MKPRNRTPPKFRRPIALTLVVLANHVVAVEPCEVALDPEAEPVPRPLQHPPLVGHPARQRGVSALDHVLVRRLQEEGLLRGRRRRAEVAARDPHQEEDEEDSARRCRRTEDVCSPLAFHDFLGTSRLIPAGSIT